MDQLQKIRLEQHRKYLKYSEECTKKDEMLLEENLKHKKIDILSKLAFRYRRFFAPTIAEKQEISGRTINRFVRKNWLAIPCVNQNQIDNIPGIYRMRIYITSHHIYEYSEKGIHTNFLNEHRLKHISANMSEPKMILFRYCFDMRKLYPVRNQMIEIKDMYFFLQPNDHVRLNSIWNKINGQNSASIIYLSKMEYDKSLCSEFSYSKENIPSIDELKNHVTEIIEEDALSNEHQNTNSVSITNTDSDPIINNYIDIANIDPEFIDNLNREYFEINHDNNHKK